MADMSPISDNEGAPDMDDAGALVLDADSAASRVAERLRTAIEQSGGQTAVMARSGVKSSTLRRVLNGQDAKRGVLVALADACGVSVEWLATGRGKPRVNPGFNEPVAAMLTGAAQSDVASVSDTEARHWLRRSVEQLGGHEQVARHAGVAAHDVERLLNGLPLPGGEAAAIIATITNPLNPPSASTEPKSIIDMIDFETLVPCFELQESLDMMAGGKLKSARSRLRRALNSYDLIKNDRE